MVTVFVVTEFGCDLLSSELEFVTISLSWEWGWEILVLALEFPPQAPEDGVILWAVESLG